MSQRYYSSTAGLMILQASISATATSLQVDTTTGLPGVTPFTLVIDAGTSLEEVVDCTALAGTTLTITRGVDSTPAQAHSTGATVRHMFSARDLREANTHVNSSNAVHGVAGALVGTTDVQALTNKDLTNASNTFPTTLATSSALTAHTSATAAHGTTGSVVGTTDAQTLTNKTLTSPTLNTPTISSPTISGTINGPGAFSGPVTGSNIQQAVGTKNTATVGGIVGSDVALVTAPAITGDGVKKFKITVAWYALLSTENNDVFDFKIKDTTAGTTLTAQRAYVVSGAYGVGGSFAVTDVPAAGSHTYQLAVLRMVGAGTGSVNAGPAGPIEIIVEQIA